MNYRGLFLALPLLFLYACVRFTPVGQSPTPAMTVQRATDTSPALTQAPAATMAPTVGQAPTKPATSQCDLFLSLSRPQILPDPASLKWEERDSEIGLLRELTGLSTILLDAGSSPDGRWWVVKLVKRFGEGGETDTALYILDATRDRHWIASSAGRPDYHQYAWLQDGGLIWTDQGKLLVADNDGSNQIDLKAPEAILEVWMGSDGEAMASGETALWRVHLKTGLWDKVPGLEDGINEGNSPVSGPGANLSVSPDGKFAALIHQGRLWRVSFAPGTEARYLAKINYPGRGGRINPPRPLAGSPYWFPGEGVSDPSQNPPVTYAMLDERDGSLIPLNELLPLGGWRVSYPSISPDGGWTAVELADANPSSARRAVYVASSQALSQGRTVEGEWVIGWQAEPPAVFLGSRSPEGLTVTRVALPYGNPLPFLSGLDQEVNPLLSTTPKVILIHEDEQLFGFDANATLLATLTPPALPKQVYALKAAREAQVMVAGANLKRDTSGSGECAFTYPLLLWDIPVASATPPP
jgi:hypothetical protein